MEDNERSDLEFELQISGLNLVAAKINAPDGVIKLKMNYSVEEYEIFMSELEKIPSGVCSGGIAWLTNGWLEYTYHDEFDYSGWDMHIPTPIPSDLL